ncbi:phosphate/phosphite/phosphonate ABC transporter substrate-binding protein [Chlorogloeopsis fritschii PCC 9212]|uniref:Putative selenate ABC transporter substrate-binding protein n=1 Tax=Chlorogloeopsis fritschii PCC 6912 TaxID=211165 RepID=A0A433MWA9_CHLFR|nr:phosphate/phosphite/phosphonate ABC transporter substrate-binding protein [Chlorogloeopsis fritschii]RUR72231.1 putative selenate ABC transporter substrate-binding protein [Chlorogloeopsis fritschii PCC 6912]
MHLFLQKISKKTLLGLAVMLALLALGCTVQSNKAMSEQENLDSKYNKQNLRIGVLPTQSQAEQQRMIKPLDEYLEKALGQQVDFQIAKDYKQVVDWLVEEKIDMAYVGAVSYFEALERGAEVEPLVAPIDKYTGRPWYRAAIIVNKNSTIKTLQDLKGKRVAFVSKSSTSGYLMPLAALTKLGIKPERDFTQVIFPGTHAKTEAMLEDGLVDAVATNIPSYIKRQTIGRLTPENSRILWESAPVPHSPMLVSKKLSPIVIKELKRAFLNTPAGMEDIVGTQAAGYTLVVASDYAPIEQLRVQLNLNSQGAK